MSMPKAPPAATPLTGDEVVRVIQGGKPALAKASDLKGLKGDPGKDAAPLRVENYTAVSIANGTATITFSPAFTTAPTVIIRSGWSNDQYVGGGVTAVSATGCTVLVKRSRGTLLLTTGPFETAPAGVAVSVIAIGR